MRHLFWLIVRIGVITALVVWFAQNPGAVSVDFQGWRVDTNVGVLLLVLAMVAATVILGIRMIRGMRRYGPIGWWRRRRVAKREKRLADGWKALQAGLIAAASGDGQSARQWATKARELPEHRPLALLLDAQAAQLVHDDVAARRHFTALAELPETEFVGLRGLIALDLKSGALDMAYERASRAFAIKRDAPWLLSTLSELQARRGAWSEMLETLDAVRKVEALGGPDLARKRAVAELGAAQQAEALGRPGDAVSHALAALKAMPEWVPAIAAVARMQIAAGRSGDATSTIEKAWRRSAHPDLAVLYGKASPTPEPLALVKRFERLVKIAPEIGAGHLALGRAALTAHLWGEARNHLTQAASLDPGLAGLAYRALADLELASSTSAGAASAAAEWREEALAAPPPPAWTCMACNTPAESWTPRCTHCQAVDALEWGSSLALASGSGTTQGVAGAHGHALVDVSPSPLAANWGD